jgi:hypothetical protein
MAVFRLLEITRSIRSGSSRSSRILLAFGHLLLPASVWLGVVTLVGGLPPWRPLVGVGLLSSAVFVFAWFRYPRASARQPGRLTIAGCAYLAAAIVITGSVLWWGGRALDGDRVSGVLWANPESFNNIRTWIVPSPGTVRTEPDG